MVGKIYYQESRGEPFKGYCLRCKKRIDNKSITAKQVVNKLMSQKSVCADCGADCGLWSVFVKEYKPDKKSK